MISYLILIVTHLITALLLNNQYKMHRTQYLKIQELQKIVADLQLEFILLPKTLTPEQILEMVTEILSKVGGSTEVLTPEQTEEIVIEILSRIGGSTEALTPEQTADIVTEIISRTGGF